MRHRHAPLLLFLVPVGLYVTALLALAAFALHPPVLDWIGLGVAAAIALMVALVGARLFSRIRVNADRLHPKPNPLYRLLVVVDDNLSPWQLRAAVSSRVAGRSHDVFVLAPVVGSLLHFLTEDEEAGRERAQTRLERGLRLLGQVGIPARGTVGADDPLQAIGDTLAVFPADEILLVSGDESTRGWLERDLERKVRDLFGVHVSGLHRIAA